MATAAPPPPEPSKSYIPHSGITRDGWSTEDEATATCYCGAIQLAVPIKPPGLVTTFLCHCADCRKITASQYASNFTVLNSHLRHLRGRENLTVWGQAETIVSGLPMTNHFCSTCGTLMYRTGGSFLGKSAMRVGTVDDFAVQETALRPRMEIFVKDRVRWLSPVPGAVQYQGIMPLKGAGKATNVTVDTISNDRDSKTGGRL